MTALTEDQILVQGLKLFNFEEYRTENVNDRQNNERFKAHFGSLPIVYARIWTALQEIDDPQASILYERGVTIRKFLMAIHFLKCYPTESQLAGVFRMSERTARTWVWYFLKKIQALKQHKVSTTSSQLNK
jgi:hypothetical protein